MFNIPFYPRIKGRIGLLGGSFDPAHQGHVHISVEAKKRLQLDQVWWLVTPQNPIKLQQKCKASNFSKRLAYAKSITQSLPWLQVSDVEQQMRTGYTHDTLAKLKQLYPEAEFVWLMGSDNLLQFHRWYRADDIIAHVPFAVCSRNRQLHRAVRGVAALRYGFCRAKSRFLSQFSYGRWCLLPIREYALSSTQLRRSWWRKICSIARWYST